MQDRKMYKVMSTGISTSSENNVVHSIISEIYIAPLDGYDSGSKVGIGT